MQPARPSWEQYALLLADAASRRSEDPWLRVGACVLRPDHSVASVGYNGAPAGVEIDWTDRDARRPLVIHAEANALRYTTPAEARGGLLAITHHPCAACLPLIAAYGITRVVYRHELPTHYDTRTLAQSAAALGLEVQKVSM